MKKIYRDKIGRFKKRPARKTTTKRPARKTTTKRPARMASTKRPVRMVTTKRPARRELKVERVKKVAVKKFKYAKSTHTVYESINPDNLKRRLLLYKNQTKHNFLVEIMFTGVDLDSGEDIDNVVSSKIFITNDLIVRWDIVLRELLSMIYSYKVLITSITYALRKVTYAETS